MTIDPKTIIENGTKVMEAVKLVKKAFEVVPKSTTPKHRKGDVDPATFIDSLTLREIEAICAAWGMLTSGWLWFFESPN